MALFGKKDKKAVAAPKKVAGKGALSKKAKQPKQLKPTVPPDIYTLLLGLSALFLIVALVILGLNYHWYQTTEPPVLPLNTWAR
jgi:hypothetical protein